MYSILLFYFEVKTNQKKLKYFNQYMYYDSEVLRSPLFRVIKKKLEKLNLCFSANILSRWTLSKKGNIGEYSISINYTEQTTGHPKQYLEPFMLNNTFSLRLCCVFESFHSYKLYSIQLDIFTLEMTVAITEPHILLLWATMNSVLKKYSSRYQTYNNDSEEHDVNPSTSSSKQYS